MFRCVVRYGYTEVRAEHELFEKILLKRLEEFESDRRPLCNCDGRVEEVEEDGNEFGGVAEAWKQGVVHFIGETEVVAKPSAGFGDRIMINYAYSFLRRNLRETDQVFEIPHKRMLKVGMTYEL